MIEEQHIKSRVIPWVVSLLIVDKMSYGTKFVGKRLPGVL